LPLKIQGEHPLCKGRKRKMTQQEVLKVIRRVRKAVKRKQKETLERMKEMEMQGNEVVTNPPLAEQSIVSISYSTDQTTHINYQGEFTIKETRIMLTTSDQANTQPMIIPLEMEKE
jgi:hypothetical protein